jgi:hypothetical protein
LAILFVTRGRTQILTGRLSATEPTVPQSACTIAVLAASGAVATTARHGSFEPNDLSPLAPGGGLNSQGRTWWPTFHENSQMLKPKILWHVFLDEVRDFVVDCVRPLIVAIRWLRSRRK